MISCMSSPSSSAGILSFEEARHVIERHAAQLHPRGTERVELLDSPGRILAEPLIADRNFPPFPRATRDGYAVRALDVADVPAALTVIGEIKAGAAENFCLGPGQTVAIMTGAAAPSGSDAVVMVEYTARIDDLVTISKSISAGDNIVPVAAEAKRGDRILSQGTRMDPAAVAVAASIGRTHLLVYSRPSVAVLSTGDEIVDIDSPLPEINQIRNSNSYSLAAQIQSVGAKPLLLPIAPDEPNRLRELIAEGIRADLLLLTGGVSMGKYDLVEQVLTDLGAEFFFTGTQIQPGRPLVFGRITRGAAAPIRGGESTPPEQTYFFGLPGNPVSTMVTFDLFARPIIEGLAGAAPQKIVFLHAQLKSGIKTKPGLKRFLPAILSGEFEQPEVELVRWQGSGDIAATARANCYAVIPPDRESIAAGEWIPLLKL